MTEQQLEEILKRRLGLEAPRFDLERLPGGKLAGSVVSNSFRGVGDAERQDMIWNALDAELGPRSALEVSTLLAYTDAEWDVDLAER